jgi:hypothetical protein
MFQVFPGGSGESHQNIELGIPTGVRTGYFLTRVRLVIAMLTN